MTNVHRPRVEPSADHRRAARQLHELFAALRQAGFSEKQALSIVGDAVAAIVAGVEAPGDDA